MPVEYTKNDAGHFVCMHKGCNKTFARQNTMYYHIMRHRNQFAFTCTDCNKGFIQKSAFLHHMAAIHPGNDEITILKKDVRNTIQEDPVNPEPRHSDCEIMNEINEKNEKKEKDNNTTTIKNPYEGQSFTCPCCNHVTRTKANALVHYARLHAKDWIPTYNKDNGCTHCKKTFSSIAAYLYHCTGCIPTNKTHRDMISRMIERE